MAETFKFQVTGITQLRAKVKAGGDPLIAEPMTAAMDQIGDWGENRARSAAPVKSGLLKSSIRHTLAPATPFPAFAKVESTAKRTSRKRRNYRYPNRLEYDPHRTKHKDWMLKAVQSGNEKYARLIELVGHAIEVKWGI